jgi:hypothetical protein
MGLDITAHRQVSLAPKGALKDDGDYDWDLYRMVYANPDFPGRAEGLQDGALYTVGIACMRFGAGNYRSYNCWREHLARVAGYPLTKYAGYDGYGASRMLHAAGAWAAEGGPFWELINFSDCEGTIGPVVSAKLARDFVEYDERARALMDDRDYELYSAWRAAFEMAADGGFVSFH